MVADAQRRDDDHSPCAESRSVFGQAGPPACLAVSWLFCAPPESGAFFWSGPPARTALET